MREKARQEIITYYLERAVWLAQQGRFGQVRQEIRTALSFAGMSPTQVDRTKVREEWFIGLGPKWVESLSEIVNSVLEMEPVEIPPENDACVQESLGILSSMGADREAQNLERRWQEYRFKTTCVQVSDAQQPTQGSQDIVRATKTRLEEAYDRLKAIIPGANKGDLEGVLSELERLSHEGHEQLPRFEWSIEGWELTGDMPAQEAINRFRELKLAQEHAHRQAEELKSKAVEALPGHPEQAAGWAEQALSLEFLPLGEREELQAFYDQVIVSALEQKELAVLLLAEAKEQSPSNLERAWDLVMKASRLVPDMPEINNEREYLSRRLKARWKAVLFRADEFLWSGDGETAQRLAERVLEQTQNLAEFKDVYQQARQIVEHAQSTLNV